MLVLTRRINETLKIGDNIEITVSNIKDGQVKLSIEAPKDIPVNRLELAYKKGLIKLAKEKPDLTIDKAGII